MNWIKKGLIFKPDGNNKWMLSHASAPVVDRVDEDVLRIYFAFRDEHVRSYIGYIEVDADNPQNVQYVHDKQVLALGKPGTFDDNGIYPSWIVNHQGKKYLYYSGWNPQVTVSYRLAIGLAISENGGGTFKKWSEGPILERALDEPYFSSAPCVLLDGEIWKMWYVSGTKWEIINERPEPFYNIKYAESEDGIHWRRTGQVCIDQDNFTDAIHRPSVFIEDGIYKMIFGYRKATNYRTDRNQSYRAGYAESPDGINWVRKDDEVGIDRSTSGWDSEMIEYFYVFEHKGKKYMFYNGNGFGKSGVGYAIRDDG